MKNKNAIKTSQKRDESNQKKKQKLINVIRETFNFPSEAGRSSETII